jgi:hypothetical protein|tara:strand:+ start:270 stop:677 length:408 start_codon:yes stop_codon:yes gene_type:complete
MARIEVFTVDRQKKYVSALYDFGADGVSASEIIPKTNSVLPKGSVIIDVLVENVIPVTVSSGTPTLTVKLGSTSIASAVDYADYSSNMDCIMPTTTVQKIANAENIGLLFSTQTITKGAVAVTIGYFDSADYQNL